MFANIDAARELADLHHLARLEDAADRAEHFGIEAHKRLRAEFLAAVMRDPSTLLHIPGQQKSEKVGDVLAGDFCDLLAHEAIAILASCKRGMAAIDPADLRARADRCLGKFADLYADAHAETLAVELEDAARDEAEEARIDALIDEQEWVTL